jgi:8-oxo-dGTP pyrophosphatase MutT (NUDIX family)
MDKSKIRNAATVIVIRDRDVNPSVLMGQRGANAAFMPDKFVFPGGAVDDGDASIPLAQPITEPCFSRLLENSAQDLRDALIAAAIRELWEETGLITGQAGAWHDPVPMDWQAYAGMGFVPSGTGLQFVFRAITPPGRPRRFDARFFLLDAENLASDPDDFSRASDELSHLQWVPIDQAQDYNLPFITEVVLAEVKDRLSDRSAPANVPFFKNDDEESLFLRLGRGDGVRD